VGGIGAQSIKKNQRLQIVGYIARQDGALVGISLLLYAHNSKFNYYVL